MKKHLLLTIVIFTIASSALPAQTKVDKFCQVYMQPKGTFLARYQAVLSIGEHAEFMSFKDTSIIAALQKVNTLTTEPDVLNYMASIGWTFVSFSWKGTSQYIYFKKEFDKSEL